MKSLLEGVTVAAVGADRPVAFAARCLADLGAEVRSVGSSLDDRIDRAWLGTWPRLQAGAHVDLLLRGAGSGADASSTAVVEYRPVGSGARHAGADLDERGLAMAGGMAVAIGEPGRPALPMPSGCLDALVGFHVAAAGLGALIDGVEHTEVAGVDVVAWAVAINQQIFLPYGIPWMRSGRRANGSGSCYPYGLFEAADGLFCMIGRTDRDWAGLRRAMGDPSWAAQPHMADPRVVGRRHADEADVPVNDWTRARTRDELLALLSEHAVPGGSVLRPDEVLDLPYLADRWRRESVDGVAVRVPGAGSDVRVADDSADPRALTGALVLDLSWVWSGPAVSVALADLGATVLKIESATRPDNSRLRGRPDWIDRDDPRPEHELAPYFHALNRGKRSVSLDLRSDEGRDILRALSARADVIVENLSEGVMARFGIAPSDVLAANPGCVFLSMRGYREHPTTNGLRAYAPVLSSSAGIEALVGYPGETPLGAMNIALSDALGTANGIMLTLAGLHARSRRGSGAEIRMSQHEGAVLANGRNLIAAQLGSLTPLVPVDEGAEGVVQSGDLADNPWVSQDLLGTVAADPLGPVSVSRTPWRRDGAFPAIGAAGPRLGAHTDDELRQRLRLAGGRIAELRTNGALT